MASWKDGAAYAPIERPDGFATPLADPLPVGDPYAAATPGPIAHPDRFDSDPAQADLTGLGTHTQTRRDPRDQFEVASMAMTAGPGKSSGRDPREAFAMSASTITAPGPPPPTGTPLSIGPANQTWPDPARPAPVATGHAGQPGPVPPGAVAPQQGNPSAPGTGWPPPRGGQQMAPQQRAGQPPAPKGAEQSRTLCWIGAGLCGFGVMLTGAAPFLLLVAGALGLRTTTRTSYLGPAALVVGALLILFQLFSATLGNSSLLGYVASLAACIWFVKGALNRD